jgi:hypothetical protein
LLGAPAPLKFKRAGNAITITMPELPEELMAQPMWVIKVSQ